MFYQCGHYQVLKLLGEELLSSVSLLVLLSPLSAHVCSGSWVVFSPAVCCVATGCHNKILLNHLIYLKYRETESLSIMNILL
jgi:hypothetical protein